MHLAPVEPAGARAPHPEAGGPGVRFREQLQERGGLYGAFAEFLRYRADLLPSEYLEALRGVDFRVAAVPRAEIACSLASELGDQGSLLGCGLEADACWSTVFRCAYRARFEGRWIVVQLARNPVSDAQYEQFAGGLRRLAQGDAMLAAAPGVLEQFREWMRLTDSPERERRYLEALSGVSDQVLQYPRVIPELSKGPILCWDWIEGEPVASLVSRGSPEVLRKVAEGVLEQICILSVVDGELDLNAIVVTSAGRLAVRRANRLISIPAARVRPALKYMSAVLAENSALAAHLLLRLALERTDVELESRLMDEFSAVEPEMKVNLRFPKSVRIFEGHWRALTRLVAHRPLFLDCAHRNLVAIGYWTGETVVRADPSIDYISEAQWPVLARLLRTRLGDLMNRETASEWVIGSGLLFFEGFRQMSRMADDFRENDLTLGLDASRPQEEDTVHSNRATVMGVLGGVLLIIFLVCLRWGASAPAPLSTLLAALAMATSAGLFWAISRLR